MVAQTIYTHVSKCKNNKRKKKTNEKKCRKNSKQEVDSREEL
jgi:hypothetical protein